MNQLRVLNTSVGTVFVRHCPSGGFHLKVGPITVNIAPEIAGFIYQELQRALFDSDYSSAQSVFEDWPERN